jgi:hypothetical protein
MELKDSLEKHGQTYPIHRSKFGLILDGWKRNQELAMLGIKPDITDHPEIATVEQYLEWQEEHLPIFYKGEKLRNYIEVRGAEFSKAGMKPTQIEKALSLLTGTSIRQIQRLLPVEYKNTNMSHTEPNDDICHHTPESSDPVLSGEYDFLTQKDKAVLSRAFKKDARLEEVIRNIREHDKTVKGTLPTLRAGTSELISVLMQRAENSKFTELQLRDLGTVVAMEKEAIQEGDNMNE